MVESTKQRATKVIELESQNAQAFVENLGMPTLHHLYEDQVGVVHAYRHEGTADKVSYFLTVYNWNHDVVVRKSSIKLFEVDFDDSLHLISTLRYDADSDTVFIILTHLYDMQVRLVEFKLTLLAEVSAGTPLEKAEVDSIKS